MSPATMPRTPPLGFCNAVMRPSRTNSTMSSGTAALAKFCAKRQNLVMSSWFSNNGRKWSDVIPDGPPVAPRRAMRRFFAKRSGSNMNSGPRRSNKSSGRGSRGTGGRFTGSESARRVACVPGARAAPSRARRPADNSTIWTNAWARSALRWTSSSRRFRRRRDATAACSTQTRLASRRRSSGLQQNRRNAPSSGFQARDRHGVASATKGVTQAWRASMLERDPHDVHVHEPCQLHPTQNVSLNEKRHSKRQAGSSSCTFCPSFRLTRMNAFWSRITLPVREVVSHSVSIGMPSIGLRKQIPADGWWGVHHCGCNLLLTH